MLEEVGKLYYQIGIECCKQGNYEDALEYFIKVYNSGCYKNEIIDVINEILLKSKDEEFRDNYKNNIGEKNLLSYDECLIDFIPVSNTKFYLFDREKGEFCGWLDLAENKKYKKVFDFHSLLIADDWDIRNMMSVLGEKNWSKVYIILDGNERKFMSFFKLPGFKELFFDNIEIFYTMHDLYEYLKNNVDIYLPKRIIAKNEGMYLSMLNELHYERIRNYRKNANNVFLSICIPTYNRGVRALESVKNILKSTYDSEIEIVISNNGSIRQKTEYEQIEKIGDARICYHEFDSNKEVAENIYKCLEIAHGKYAFLISDEDEFIYENLAGLLNYCINSDGLGSFICTESNKGKVYTKGEEAIKFAITCTNYLTGCCFNMEMLRRYHVIDELKKMSNNAYVTTYPHSAICFMLGLKSNLAECEINIWELGEEENISVECGGGILFYTRPEHRIKQIMGILELLQKFSLEKEINNLFAYIMSKRYYYQVIAVYTLKDKIGDDFRKKYSWQYICRYGLEQEMLLFHKWNDCLYDGNTIKYKMQKTFIKWISYKDINNILTEEEKFENAIIGCMAEYCIQKNIAFENIKFDELNNLSLDILRDINCKSL